MLLKRKQAHGFSKHTTRANACKLFLYMREATDSCRLLFSIDDPYAYTNSKQSRNTSRTDRHWNSTSLLHAQIRVLDLLLSSSGPLREHVDVRLLVRRIFLLNIYRRNREQPPEPLPYPFLYCQPLALDILKRSFLCKYVGLDNPIKKYLARSKRRRDCVSRLVHFEIHVNDMERAKQFYGEVFGWTFEDWSEYAGMPYFGATTGPADELGVNGALVQRRGQPPNLVSH